jgi:hypothetical protein
MSPAPFLAFRWNQGPLPARLTGKCARKELP